MEERVNGLGAAMFGMVQCIAVVFIIAGLAMAI